MRRFLVDASALGKRYVVEDGTPVVNRLFVTRRAKQLIVLTHTIAETFAIAVRRRNDGRLSTLEFEAIMWAMRRELLVSRDMHTLPTDDARVLASLPLIERHALNATDALVLRSALDLMLSLQADGDDLVVVAPDDRLLRAAKAEGLTTLNPLTDTPAVVSALIEQEWALSSMRALARCGRSGPRLSGTSARRPALRSSSSNGAASTSTAPGGS